MDMRRYQVFISSTFKDLEDERISCMRAIMGMNSIPAGMEDFPAFDSEQFDYIKGVIDASDYYILLIAGKYGSISDSGISYTEMEYDYAKTSGKTVLAFPYRDIEALPGSKLEKDPKIAKRLLDFRSRVMENRVVRLWESEQDLVGQIVIALTQALRQKPAVGWIRGDSDNTEKLAADLNKFRKENLLLISKIEDREAEIQKLHSAFSEKPEDAHQLYTTASEVGDRLHEKRLSGSSESDDFSRDRKIAQEALEAILEKSLKFEVSGNILFNAGITAQKLRLDIISIKLHCLAQYFLPSPSHEMALNFRQVQNGIAYEARADGGEIVLSRVDSPPGDIIERGLEFALRMMADSPLAQCEIIYSQGWNILQHCRDRDGFQRGSKILLKSYFARMGDSKNLKKLADEPEDPALPVGFDWKQQEGKTVPSYLLQKIGEMEAILSGGDWIDRTKEWVRTAERVNAGEFSGVTWYSSTVEELNELIGKIKQAESRLSNSIDI